MNQHPTLAALLMLMLATGSAAKERLTAEEAQGLLNRALTVNDLRACGVPFRLEADIELPQPDGRTLAGKYALVWVGPERFHRELVFPGYVDIHVRPDATTDWVILPAQAPLTILRRFDEDFLGVTALQGATELRARKPDGRNVTCLDRSDGGAAGSEACIDADDGFLVSFRSMSALVSRATPREFHGRLCPETVSVRRDGALALTARLTTLVAEPDPNPAYFAKPEGAKDGAKEPQAASLGAVTPPKQIHRVDPVFPHGARERGKAGMAVVECMVNTDGTVTALKILQSAGDFELDEAAKACVSQWKYEPATRDGVPVAVNLVVRVTFR